MSHRLVYAMALLFLVSGLCPQMVTSAPTPQREEGIALAGQAVDNGNSLLEADSWVSAGQDDGNGGGTTEFRYGGWWKRGEPAKPPDIRVRNQHPTGPHSPPQIHIIDNVNLLFSSSQDHARHASSTTSSNTSSLPSPSPSPPPTRTMTPRSVNQDDRADHVFNIVIQKEKTQKSAFIAPDVTWLRDLVPKVVDVVDKSETTIKEAVFGVMNKKIVDNDRQVLVNVVKAQVDSEFDVPQILGRLRNLMQTGEGIDSKQFETETNSSVPSLYLPVIINVVIVNVLNVNVVNVILPEATTELNFHPQARTPDSAIAEDSYIEALKESQKNRNQGSPLAMKPPHADHQDEEHHQAEPHSSPHVVSQLAAAQQQQVGGVYLTEVPAHEYVSTGRPLMAMEKIYLRSYDVKQSKPQVANTAKKQEHSKSQMPELPIEGNAGAEFVNLPTGPYFTKAADTPVKIEILEVNKVAETGTTIGTTPKPAKKPLQVRTPGAISQMTNKATSAVRNQIRVIGFVAIPLLAGLASTVNAWLPAMAQLGRRRKKRSVEPDQFGESWQHGPKFTGFDDRRRAIQDAQVLALLMGQRYMNVSKESLQESIDNWKNRDQEAAGSPYTTDTNKLASTNRPLWFQFQRANTSQVADSTIMPPTTTVAPSTVNRPIYEEEEYPQTNDDYNNNNNNNNKPLFYSAAGIADDVVDDREVMEYDDTENVGSSTSSSDSTSTELLDYEEKETQPEENVAATYTEPVTPHIHILPDTSPSGNDFDIVANFVQAMMMNGNDKNRDTLALDRLQNREDFDGPEHRQDMDGLKNREDLDGPENRENIFFVKAASIVNSTKTSSPTTTKPKAAATRLPPIGSGSTVGLFSADAIMPNWTNTNEKVTNSPVTYVAIRAPPIQPSQPTTTTLSTQSYDYDIDNLNDGDDQMFNEQVSAPLQFHEDDSGIAFFVSKDVPSRITTTTAAAAGQAETKPTGTGRPLSQWFSDPFENGLFVGSSTTNTIRPSTSSSSIQAATRPSSSPAPPLTSSFQSIIQPTKFAAPTPSTTDLTFSSGTRPALTTFNSQSSSLSGSRPTALSFNSQWSSLFGSRPTTPMFNLQSSFQSVTRPVSPPSETQSALQFGNRPTAPVRPPAKLQSAQLPSLLTMASFTAPPRQRPALPPPVNVSNGMSKYTKNPYTMTTPSHQDLSTLTEESSHVAATGEKNTFLVGIVKGAALTSPIPQPSTGQPTTSNSMSESSDVNPLFGEYSSTSTPGTSRPFFMSSASRPVSMSSISRPFSMSSISRPFSTSSASRPVSTSSTGRPVSTSSISRPVSTSSISRPVLTSSAIRPVSTSSTSRPVSTSSISRPVSMSSTSRPVSTTGVSEQELDTALDNVAFQSETDLTSGGVSTGRPIGGIHFLNTSTDYVIISPYDVTPGPVFSPLQVEGVESEINDEESQSSDAIVVDAEPGNQPDSVPVVSSLANVLLAPSSSSSSSGSSGSSDSSGLNDGSVSSAGFISSTSATLADPFPLFYTVGLASVGILALTLPIWIPLMIAKKKRRTGGYGPIRKKDKKKKVKNQYPAKKKKTHGNAKPTYGEPPPNHYKDLDEELIYYDDDYQAGPETRLKYHSATVDDLYRNGGPTGHDYSSTHVDNYSTSYRDLIASNSDDAFSDVGPLNSEDVYGPSTSNYYDGKKAARRRRSTRNKKFKLSLNKRSH